MHNLAREPAQNKGVSWKATLIRVDTFQPFESRLGIDLVMRLSFEYDPVLIAHLKRFLTAYKADAVNPSLRRMTPGGWLPEHRCWFFETSIWDAVRLELEFAGYPVMEVNP